MDIKGKFCPKPAKRISGFFRSIHRLPTTFVKDCGFIPIVLINTAAVVEKYIKTKEIFQTQGTPSKAYATLNQLSKGWLCRINPNLTVHDAVEAMKLVLVSLPEALIPEDVCDSLITASRENSADQYGNILAKFRMKSPLNFGILHFMMILLKKVSMHTQQNLMDVRKLATIFVLDVIKPLKLDDPNDGEFLSERMQRLPYLIMVVEKLILNVDIFKSARSKKPETDTATGQPSTTRHTTASSGAGSGDSAGGGEDRPKHTGSKPAAAHAAAGNVGSSQRDPSLRTVPSSGRAIAKSTTSAVSPGLSTRVRIFRSKPLPSAARCFHSSRFRVESVVFQNPDRGAHGPPPTPATPNTSDRNPCSTAENISISDLPLPPPLLPRSCFVEPNPKSSEPARCPRFKSKASSTTTLHCITGSCGLPSCVSNQPEDNSEAPSLKNRSSEPMVKASTLSKDTSLAGYLKEDDGDKAKGAHKEWRPGRKARTKASSLPPCVQPRPVVTSKRGRALSCTGSADRRWSSANKKRLPVRGRVWSFREGDTRALVMEKRRTVSLGALNSSGSSSGSGNCAAQWRAGGKRALSAGRKRPGEQNSCAASPVIYFSRGSDRITFTADEMISPWHHDGMAADDTSLMSRTIRNPRILPVPPSLPVSPVTTELSTRTSRRDRCRVRNSGQPSSISSKFSSHSCHSLCLPSNLTSSPSGYQRTTPSRAIDPIRPTVSDTSSVGISALPSAKTDSRPGSAITRNSLEGTLGSVKRSTLTSPGIISSNIDKNPCSLRSEKEDRRTLRENRRCESLHSHHKCDGTSRVDGEKGLTSQATGNDVASFSCFDGHSQGGGGAKEAGSTTSTRSPLQKSAKAARSPLKPQQGQSSQEFVSLSSPRITLNVWSYLTPHKSPQGQQQAPHYRRVSLQQLCQVRQPGHVPKQQPCRRGRFYYAWCLLILTLLLLSGAVYFIQEVRDAS